MPLALIWGASILGGGYFLSRSTGDVAQITKWVAIGGAVYTVAKVTKVI